MQTKAHAHIIFSIIVVNFDSSAYVVDLIESWLASDSSSNVVKNDLPSWEMVIVDNYSTQQKKELELINDKISSLPNNMRGRFKIVAASENKGFGAGNNLGVQNAIGEWLFLLNADTLVNRSILLDWQNEIDAIFKNTNNMPLLLAPQLLLADGQTRQKYAWGIFPNLISLIKQKDKKEIINYPTQRQGVDWVSGAAMVLSKNNYEQINGFDEKFFMYLEDVDFCLRLKDKFKNQNIYLAPLIKVVHLGGKSIKLNRTRYQLYFKAQDYYWQKHFGALSTLIMKMVRCPYKTIKLMIP